MFKILLKLLLFTHDEQTTDEKENINKLLFRNETNIKIKKKLCILVIFRMERLCYLNCTIT